MKGIEREGILFWRSEGSSEQQQKRKKNNV